MEFGGQKDHLIHACGHWPEM